MLSMTGFGSQRQELDNGVLQIQISAVNHRHCQVSVRSDFRDLSIDERIKKACRKQIKRGSVSVNVQWQAAGSDSLPLDQLKQCYQQLKALADELEAPAPRLESLASWVQRYQSTDEENNFEMIESCLQGALEALQDMRRVEGQQMAAVFKDLHKNLSEICTNMSSADAARVDTYRERLIERVSSVLEDKTIDEKDLIKEVAVYADRIDISEEIARLHSHLEQLEKLFASEKDECGKRLEFLLQECGREVNTVGSKAHDAALSQLVVDAKSVLEQMREQAANIL